MQRYNATRVAHARAPRVDAASRRRTAHGRVRKKRRTVAIRCTTHARLSNLQRDLFGRAPGLTAQTRDATRFARCRTSNVDATRCRRTARGNVQHAVRRNNTSRNDPNFNQRPKKTTQNCVQLCAALLRRDARRRRTLCEHARNRRCHTLPRDAVDATLLCCGATRMALGRINRNRTSPTCSRNATPIRDGTKKRTEINEFIVRVAHMDAGVLVSPKRRFCFSLSLSARAPVCYTKTRRRNRRFNTALRTVVVRCRVAGRTFAYCHSHARFKGSSLQRRPRPAALPPNTLVPG